MSAHSEPEYAMRVLTLREQRKHKAMLWRNVRAADRLCVEHAETLRQVFAPMLALRLPRVPNHQ